MSTSMIRVPTSLHAGLKSLAASRNVSMVALIHDLVRDASDAGEISSEHSSGGVKLELDLDDWRLSFSWPGAKFASMTYSQAQGVIDAIGAALNEKGAHSASTEHGTFTAQYVGTGIVLKHVSEHGETARHVVTTSAARDLRRSLIGGAEAIKRP